MGPKGVQTIQMGGQNLYNPYPPNDPNYQAWAKAYDALGGDNTAKLLMVQQGKKFQLPKGPGVSKMPALNLGKDTGAGNSFNGLRTINAAVQYDSEGRPIRNPYLAMVDGQGNLMSQFRMADKIGADIQLDKTALNAIQNRALSTGPSAWASLAEQKQRAEQQNMLNQNMRSVAANQNRAYSSLAARGGVSAGQRERLAMQGQRTGFQGAQSINNQGALQRMGIGLQDQQQKDAFLQQLPGMQQNAAAFDQSQRAYRNTAISADVGNAMKDIHGFNLYQSGATDAALKEWAANKQADAMARSSGGGKK